MRDVLVIGDVHGHVDRLEKLIKQEDPRSRDAIVVQLGDLGHFGGSAGSPTGDLMAWQLAYEGVVDYVLWGNHDRAVIDSYHEFGGYERPDSAILHMMRTMEKEGRLLVAFAAHGWLITHAGLHAQFKFQKTPPSVDKKDPRSVADWLNQRSLGEETEPVIDAIGGKRGGWSAYGGVLWRDISEKLYKDFPQVFGHSASRKHKVRGEKDQWHCIDIGGKGGSEDPDADCLAGIWLPSQEVVRINLKDTYEVLRADGIGPKPDPS